MTDLPNPLTRAERAFWRKLWRQHEKERRINRRVLADMLSGKKMRTRKAAR
jgi:hypothetical protein